MSYVILCDIYTAAELALAVLVPAASLTMAPALALVEGSRLACGGAGH